MRRACRFAVVVLSLSTVLAVLPCVIQAQQGDQAGQLEYSAEEVRSTPPEVFLERMAKPEPGYQKFAAMHALAQKAKGSDPDARWSILNLVISAMYDSSRSEYQRLQCCYVISESEDQRGVPYLIEVLFRDPSTTMRSVAAEALGGFTSSSDARNALAQAAKQETDPKVLEVINRRLAEGDAEYTPEQIKATPAETFIERLAKPEPGYQQFAAMRALGRKARESDTGDRAAILNLVVAVMNDKSRTENQRFQCCYVISDCGDEQWVPYLVDVLFGDPSSTMRAVAAEALASFKTSAAAQNALLVAAQEEKNQKVLDVINRNRGTADYTAEQIAHTSAETFLARMQQPETGYHKFAAMRALGKKAKASDAAGRRAILTMVVNAMNDKSRTEYQRFQCCYVICDSGDEAYVPYLVDVLMKDPSATMRSVAAEALGKFPKSAKAHDALVQAARTETNQRVLEVLNRVLGRTGAAS